MVNFTEKSCQQQGCDNKYTPKGPSSKFCSKCAELRRKESSRRNTNNYRLRNNMIQKPGVGSGNNQGIGSEHHSYTTGIGCDFQNRRRYIKDSIRYCERCSKDLINASRYFWCLHHIDHNRSNNSDDNFELLCKRCHQIEHDCHRAFESVETISKESRDSREDLDIPKRQEPY